MSSQVLQIQLLPIARFSVRSNAVAHGKTKHSKSVIPIVIDITKGDCDMMIDTYLQDSYKDDLGDVIQVRRPDTLPSKNDIVRPRCMMV